MTILKHWKYPRWKYLLTLCVAGVGLTGIMGFAGVAMETLQ